MGQHGLLPVNRCPNRPSELGIVTVDGNDTWWPGQQETVDNIVEGLWEHKFVLANIPTGGGKTIVSTAVQRLLGLDALALTATIQLQEQYQETMPWAKLATGKRNHQCGRSADDPLVKLFGYMNADDCEEYGGGCLGDIELTCGYQNMIEGVAGAQEVIANYAYAIRILSANSLKKLGYNPFRRPFLICDEGHLVEDAVVEAVSLSLWRRPCDEAGLREWPESSDIWQWIAWASDNRNKAREWLEESRTAYRTAVDGGSGEALRSAAQWNKRARALYDTIGRIRTLKPDEWAVSPGSAETKLRPLWAWSIIDNRLWQYSESVLVMSATLGDPENLMAKLAIDPKDAVYLDVPSTFPVQNRPIFYWPVAAISRNSDQDDWKTLASAIEHIANTGVLKEKKGLIHTASYNIVENLRPLLQGNPRYVFHSKPNQKEDMIYALRNESNPIICLSPSMTTGVDIKEIGFQIIVKVPFGNLGDPITRMRREYKRADDPYFGRRNYDVEAANTVVQACGRAVRSPTDVGVTYILDQNWWPLYKRTYHAEWFKEAVKWLR